MGASGEILEYLGARTIVAGLGLLPPAGARGIGELLGRTTFRFGVRRDTVRTQLAASFPDRSAAWIDRTSESCYRHFGREAASIARLQRTGPGPVPAQTDTDAATAGWIRDMADGRGTLVVTGHIGNWEVAGALLAARGVPLAAVVKRQRNARFDAWLGATRRRLGIEPVYMDDARREVPRLLASGRSVALVADQDARSRGLEVTFMGRPASTFRGPARLAIETGAPLVFGVAVRSGGGYLARIEPVDRADRGDETDELELTRRWVARLETWVRAYPEQYFWFHRRWKSAAHGVRNEGASDA